MVDIDGSQKSGSGTILRLSVALAAVERQPLHIYNIRQERSKPGLRPQHLEAVLTAARLCNAELKGAELNSRELWFVPQSIKSGDFEAEIGTAGSIPMLFMTVLPICAFAKATIRLHVSKGGTDVQHSPTTNYMRHVLLPTLNRMGLNAIITVHKYGYYPKGMGEASLTVKPWKLPKSIRLDNFGMIESIKGVSVCTFLEQRRVAERQAEAATALLNQKGYRAQIKVLNDKSNPVQKGSSVALWAETDKGAILGADAIGELGKPSEAVGKEAARKLLKELSSKATVDVHLADILIPYIAFVKDRSVFLTRKITEHLETNMWLAEKIWNVKFKARRVGNLHEIEKLE